MAVVSAFKVPDRGQATIAAGVRSFFRNSVHPLPSRNPVRYEAECPNNRERTRSVAGRCSCQALGSNAMNRDDTKVLIRSER